MLIKNAKKVCLQFGHVHAVILTFGKKIRSEVFVDFIWHKNKHN